MTCTRPVNGTGPNNNAPAVLQTPGGRSHLYVRCNVHDRTYAPDVESTGFARAGPPDDPNLEMELAPEPPHDDGPTSGGSALFPEIPTWSDEQFVVAIELADRREPGLTLYAVGEDLPDRHEAFLHECSAELVRRLEERGVRFAA